MILALMPHQTYSHTISHSFRIFRITLHQQNLQSLKIVIAAPVTMLIIIQHRMYSDVKLYWPNLPASDEALDLSPLYWSKIKRLPAARRTSHIHTLPSVLRPHEQYSTWINIILFYHQYLKQDTNVMRQLCFPTQRISLSFVHFYYVKHKPVAVAMIAKLFFRQLRCCHIPIGLISYSH